MNHSEETFGLIVEAVEYKIENPEQRWGQAIFNVAYFHTGFISVPDFVNPYNDDTKVSIFLQWLENHGT